VEDKLGVDFERDGPAASVLISGIFPRGIDLASEQIIVPSDLQFAGGNDVVVKSAHRFTTAQTTLNGDQKRYKEEEEEEEGRRKKEEGRRKKKKEEGRRKKEEGRRKKGTKQTSKSFRRAQTRRSF